MSYLYLFMPQLHLAHDLIHAVGEVLALLPLGGHTCLRRHQCLLKLLIRLLLGLIVGKEAGVSDIRRFS